MHTLMTGLVITTPVIIQHSPMIGVNMMSSVDVECSKESMVVVAR